MFSCNRISYILHVDMVKINSPYKLCKYKNFLFIYLKALGSTSKILSVIVTLIIVNFMSIVKEKI